MRRKTAVLMGAGMAAKSHVAACAAAADKVHLKAVLSRTLSKAEILAAEATRQSGETTAVWQSIDQVLHDPEIDFVIIATPPDVRMEIIEPLARAGKHILLEKPVGRDSVEAGKVVDFCQQSGVMLGLFFQHRARAASVRARELVQSGTMGALGVVEIHVPWWRAQSYYDEPGRGSYQRDGGGVLITQAIHTIDLALSLAGPVNSVRAMTKTTRFHDMESEDFVVAGLEFCKGAVGTLVASTASFPGRSESIVLHFDTASLYLERGQLTVHWRSGKVDVFGEQANSGAGADPMAFTHEWHQSVIENFVDALHGDAELLASGKQAMLAHGLIDAILRSADSQSTEYLSGE